MWLGAVGLVRTSTFSAVRSPRRKMISTDFSTPVRLCPCRLLDSEYAEFLDSWGFLSVPFHASADKFSETHRGPSELSRGRFRIDSQLASHGFGDLCFDRH